MRQDLQWAGAGHCDSQLVCVHSSASSARNAWAVGSYSTGTTDEVLILHWDGTAWK
jgi:hypothetical protein